MKSILASSLLLGLLLLGQPALACPPTLDHSLRPLAGSAPERLCERFAGKVLLVVNTASFCGFTPQFEGLQTLYRRYRDQGLVVAGFPSNDFAQDPKEEGQIRDFCELTYGVEFPMFEKVHVNRGPHTHPFYQQLAREGDGPPRWNFHKYLLDRDGRVIASFPSRVEPDDEQLIRAIEELL